ncbi:hypothetical protein HPP92_000797 [Vanilla planifolia]|uniref:Small ribosomal subunit protein uS9c n=1 Tax=Vanilla planifolia TaxID=51239 RepID=A0A835VKT3_VANPL|nr:hypothetical protein HPP92_000797 [Vanilla planifolia]
MAVALSSLVSSFYGLSISANVFSKPNKLSFYRSRFSYLPPLRRRFSSSSIVASSTSIASVAGPTSIPSLPEIEGLSLEKYVKSRLPGGFAAQRIIGTGRRKCSIARVVLQEGTGKFVINYRDAKEYLQGNPLWLQYIRTPLVTLGYETNYDVFIKAHGGGLSGQSQAISLGIARALLKVSENHRAPLRKEGLLTRDSRVVERKKKLKINKKGPAEAGASLVILMSASGFQSVSLSISDDESDDPAGRIRLGRRKCKKRFFRPSRGILGRFMRSLARWWLLLLFVPAMVLLTFEASKQGKKQIDAVRMESRQLEGALDERSNLNRLDHTTRIVNGVRELCLKMLKPEELHNLDFPEYAVQNSPVKSLMYKSYSGQYASNSNSTMLSYQNGTTRFNLFTGYQTLEEREDSYNVEDNAEVHCGFYNDNGGFKISDEDKQYMQTCKAVVSTCAFGGGDDLYQPIGMTEASLKKVCYVAFWDEITRGAQEAEGNNIGIDGMIGKWRIVVVSDLPFSDQRLNGKIPKMLSHRLFPQARYSIWVDSKSQFRRDPFGVLEALLWRTNSVFAISEHGARSNLYEEAKAIVKKHKATPEEVDAQIKQYRYDGIPEDRRLHGKKALAEASVIIREHNPLTNVFMCLWFNEVVRFTSRDQLSFPYVLRRLKIRNLNMFPVCTRKDLVNSMGHKRKVKPLESRMLLKQ